MAVIREEPITFTNLIRDIAHRRDDSYESIPRVLTLGTSPHIESALRLAAPDLTPEYTGYRTAAVYDFDLSRNKTLEYLSLYNAINRARRFTPVDPFIFTPPSIEPDEEEVY